MSPNSSFNRVKPQDDPDTVCKIDLEDATDLKLGDFKAEYKAQMELYLRWLAKHEQQPNEAAPLGIILCAGKKQEQIELLTSPLFHCMKTTIFLLKSK